MKGQDTPLDRLFRSAANASQEPVAEPPFGFDTRVVALWRTSNGDARDVAELTPFLQRIGATAFIVLALASTAVYQQANDNEARAAPQTNEYAIADSAIQTEFSP